MVREVAPNLSYHYWYLGVIGLALEEEADPLVMVRGSEFQHSREIEMVDDEGHMGTATTKISSYRSSATASPSFTDKCRYGEGWEDIWLLLLGSAKGGNGADKNDIIKADKGNGAYGYTFQINVNAPQNPYLCTLYNGFAKTTTDAYKYENCLLSEFELSGSNEEAPTYTATFSSNYPKVNQTNPARVVSPTTTFPKSSSVKIYIAPVGTTDANTTTSTYEYPCYIDWSMSINNNIEAVPCSSDDFGTSTKVLGNREGTFNITLPWTSATKNLEKMFETGANDGTTVTSDNFERKVMIVMEDGTIGSSEFTYKTVIKIPKVVITSAYSEQSGTDAKQIQLEGNIEETGSESFVRTLITTDLADLHIDNTASSP